MEKIMSRMIDMLNIQNEILKELDTITDKSWAGHIGQSEPSKVYNDDLETVEKNYLLLDTIIKKTYDLLVVSRGQKDKLYKYATNIRSSLSKEKPLTSINKFIDVLDSHFIDGSHTRIQSHNHKDMYKAVRQYHENSKHTVQNQYSLYKSVPLQDSHSVDIPIVNKLSDILPMFNWYTGDKKHPAGIYICLTEGVHIQVPFPDLISKNSKNFKHKSIPCKYKTAIFCREKQEEYSRIYGTELRQCNFVHFGESFIKIGSDFRCPNLPSFGAFDTLKEDIMLVPLSDIKTLLFNSSSDLLLILLWRKYHKNLGEIVFTNLDKLIM